MKSDTLVLIPARYQSARFPGKPLTLLNKVPMVERVYKICEASGFESYVVTDSQKIEDCVKGFSGNVLRVDDDVRSGTERIALAFKRFLEEKGNINYIINVQGDEPLLKPESLSGLQKFHAQSSFDVTTMVRKEKCLELKKNPDRVKAVFNPENGQCLYFSRAEVPYIKDKQDSDCWFHHIGVYSYTKKALEDFVSFGPSLLEKKESLEQLRGLEHGLKYGAIEIEEATLGVDDPEDVKKVEELLSEKAH